MANEAFADSPISARTAQPSEADFAAISEALMETARGRWFLAEFARRNRNADTRLVLDKVALLEESLAARQQVDTVADTAPTIAAIRDIVEAAQASTAEALDALALDHKLASVRRSTRVLREISWRLREIGNDARICDLIDAQVAMIENDVTHMSADEARRTLQTSLASIAERLAAFSDADGALQGESRTAADALDEAVLDMIAMEMGAPQPIEDDGLRGTIIDEPSVGAPASSASEAAAPTTLPLGPVKSPTSVAADPLAPIRRMSQAEKIALFS